MMTLAWWQIILIFGVGVILGLVAYRFFIHKPTAESTNEPSLEKELQNYKNAVHQHLMHSTELLQQLGTDYQSIVDHLRKGIHELGKPTSQGGSVIPHFPQAHVHDPNHEKQPTMPKTYVDSRSNKEK